MSSTEHDLPFSQLSSLRFEKLCFALLQAEGHTSLRHWGAGGNERGCDVVSTAPDDRRWVTQAKRTTAFGPTAAVAELVKVLDDPPDPEPEVYLLAAPCALTRDTEEALAMKIAERGKTWDVLCWGLTELDAKVRTHPEVRKRLFGEPWKLLDPHWNVPGTWRTSWGACPWR